MDKVVSASVRSVQGKPILHINGQPTVPMMYALTLEPMGKWSWQTIPAWNMKLFGEAGLHLKQVYFRFEEVWMSDGSLDMSIAIRQIQGILDADPDACVMLRIHMNAPLWWNEAHPEECVGYADTRAEYGAWELDAIKTHSFASELWKQEVGEAYTRFLKALEATEQGNRVFGIQVADGVYGEWHQFGFIEHDPDTGEAMHKAFRRFLRARYQTDDALRAAWGDPLVTFETAAMPDTAARERTSDGIFRAYGKEQNVVDYYECIHDAAADAIIHFCALTKHAWSRPIVTATFFGYFFTLFNRQAAGGHLAIERVLNADAVDCICAPQSYFVSHRAMGGTGQARMVLESARLHGKLTLDEMDQAPYNDVNHPEVRDIANTTLEDSLNIIRRNVFAPVSRGMGLWYFDFGPRDGAGWWMEPEFMCEIKELYDFLAPYCLKPYDCAPDVLVVYDAKSFLYTANNQFGDPLTDNLAINELSSALYHSGAWFDAIYSFDLERVELDRYKTIVFANAYFMDEKTRRFIKEKVAANGRHIVWCYAPDAVSEAGADAEKITGITGITVERSDCANPLALEIGPEKRVFDIKKRFSARYPLKRFEPVFEVQDDGAEVIGRYAKTDAVALAKKAMPGWTSWYFGVPLFDADTLRAVFRESGAHIYGDGGDTFLVGSGLILVHTLTGGERCITLRNGKCINITLQPRSSVFLDAETGERLR